MAEVGNDLLSAEAGSDIEKLTPKPGSLVSIDNSKFACC